jgi:hypothetical protein
VRSGALWELPHEIPRSEATGEVDPLAPGAQLP